MTAAMKTPYDVSGAAYLPSALAAGSAVSYVSGAGASVTAIRVEGPRPSVEYRCEALRRNLAAFGETEELHGRNSALFWRELRDVSPFSAAGDTRCVWRISVPPKDGPKAMRQLPEGTGGEAYLDWGGGLIWLALDAPADAMHQTVRAAIAAPGGHATLIRAPEPVRAAVPVFQPPSPGIARLFRGLKENFDPRGVLNPGRMYADL
jgi:glycolate oxidase FAD binding subunit